MATATRLIQYNRTGIQTDQTFSIATLPTVTGIDIWRIIPAFGAYQMNGGYTVNVFAIYLQGSGNIRLPIAGTTAPQNIPQASAMGTMHYPGGMATNILTNASNQGSISELTSIGGQGYPYQGADMSSYSSNWGPSASFVATNARVEMVNFTYGKPGDQIMCRVQPSSNNDVYGVAFQAVLIGDGN